MQLEKKFYLTKEGMRRIKEEYNKLKKIKLVKTQEDVPRVLHSEELNPEYLSFREDLGFVETRLVELENILNNTILIKTPPKEKQSIVALGATISVEVDGQKDEFAIVGSLEANPATGKISNESPVGRALLGHGVGDEVIVSSPIKTIYKIKKIKYHSI